MKRLCFFVFLLLLVSAETVRAQAARKYVNEFLHMGTGARAFAMGRAVVATSNDAYAGYWNPAGLTAMKDDLQAAFMHASYYQGLANYDYLALAAKGSNDDAFGFGVVRFGVDGILNTLDLIQNGQINYDRISTFSAVDYGFFVNYAREKKLKRYRRSAFSYGSSMKVIHRRVGPFARAWGFSLDAGLRMDNPRSGITWGLMARDISSSYNAWEFRFTDAQKDVLALTGNTIPRNSLEIGLPRVIGGLAKTIDRDRWLLTAEGNIDVTWDGRRNTIIRTGIFSLDPHAGAEFGYKLEAGDEDRILYLRTGVYNLQREAGPKGNQVWRAQPAAGIGLRIQSFTLDYAISGFGETGTGLYSNLISIRFGISQ